MHFVILLIISLLAPVNAVDVLFFEEDGICDTTNLAYLTCSDLTEQRCCQSKEPFCVTSNLHDLGGSTDHYVMGEGFCDKNGIYTSVRDYPGLSSCINIPVDTTSDWCSSYWESAQDQEEVVSDHEDHKIDCQEPDKMAYYDGTAMRKIRLPGGTFQDAVEYYREKDFGELAKFPAWDDSDIGADVQA